MCTINCLVAVNARILLSCADRRFVDVHESGYVRRLDHLEMMVSL